MDLLKIVLIILGALYLLTGVFLWIFQENLIFRDEPLDADFEYVFQSDFDELNLEMEDGAVLNALHFKSDQPKGLILYFHGNAGNLARWGEIVQPFTNYGYEVLVVDYRGYGKSTGKRTKELMLLDAEWLYGYASELFPQEKIMVYGRSLGGAFACHVSAKFNPRKLILESPFYSVSDVAKVLGWIYPTSSILKFNFNNGEIADRIKCPVTILHGSKDEVVPLQSGEKLAQKIKKKSLHVIEGGGHNDLANFKNYWSVIDEVLK